MNINKNFTFLTTDYYHLAMAFVYIMENKANELTTFEGFSRSIKKTVDNEEKSYYFKGHQDTVNLMNKISNELKDETLIEKFIFIIKEKIEIKNWENEFRKKWKNLIKDFDYNVIEDNSIVKPYIPVFQFKGPRWIGTILETLTTNTYNGQTGFNTVNLLSNDEKIKKYYSDIMSNNSEEYKESIKKQLKLFNEASKEKVKLEAGFRRSPNLYWAIYAAINSKKYNWQGTSNTADEVIEKNSLNFIGGSMAHAFVMSFEDELTAFKIWYKYFPSNVILVDTYNILNSVKLLIDNNIEPKCVRIDSGDFFDIVPKIKKMFKEKNWNNTQIFISGDITPDLLLKLKEKNVEYDKYMAGTKIFYPTIKEAGLNPGFVYKLTSYINKNGKKILNEKTADGKRSYSGLKEIISYDKNENILYIKKDGNNFINNNILLEINRNTKIIFKN